MLRLMQQHSLFLTESQLRHTIQAHLKRINQRLSPGVMKVLDTLRAKSRMALGVSYLKIATIAELAKVSEATVKRAIRQLEKIGVIKRIPNTNRPKLGGDGANMYQFQPCSQDDPAPMTLRPDEEMSTGSKAEKGKSDKHTGFSLSLKPNTLKDNTYVPKHRLKKDPTVIPSYIPKDFVKEVRQGANKKMIKELWTRVIMFKRRFGYQRNESVLQKALEAWEYTKNAYKRDRKEWQNERFLQCFYGTLKKIEEEYIKELRLSWV